MPPRKKSKNSLQSDTRKDANKLEHGKEPGVHVVDLTNMTADQESRIQSGTSIIPETTSNCATLPQFTEEEDWNMLQMVKEAEELYVLAQEEMGAEMRFQSTKHKCVDTSGGDPSGSSSSPETRKNSSEVRVMTVLDGMDDPLPPGLIDALEKAEQQLAPPLPSPSLPPPVASDSLLARENVVASTDTNTEVLVEGKADVNSPITTAPNNTLPPSLNPYTHQVDLSSPNPPPNPQGRVASPNPTESASKTALTAQQRLMMEENKRKAKERKEKKEKLLQQQQQQSNPVYHMPYPPPPTKPIHNSYSSTQSNSILPPQPLQVSSSSSSSTVTSYSLLPNKRPLPDATTNDYLVDSGSSLEESQSSSVGVRSQYIHPHHQNYKQPKFAEQPNEFPKLSHLPPTGSFPPTIHKNPSQLHILQPPLVAMEVESSPAMASTGLFALPTTIPSSILSRCLIYNWPTGVTVPLDDKNCEALSYAVGFSTTDATPETDTSMHGGKGIILYCINGVFRKQDNYALYLAAKLAWNHSAALLAVVMVDEQAENDLSKCIQLNRSGADGGLEVGLLDSRENSFIRKNVNSLSAKSSFASSLQEIGISVIGLVCQDNQATTMNAATCAGSDGNDEQPYDSLQVASLIECLKKITSSGEYKLQGIVSDYTGHPALHHMNLELTKKLPFIPHIAVDSISLLSNPHKPNIDTDGTFAEFRTAFMLQVSRGDRISSCDVPDVSSTINKERQDGVSNYLASCLPTKGSKVITSTTSPIKVTLIDWKRVNATLVYYSTCIVTSDKFFLWSETSANEQLDKLVEDFVNNGDVKKRNDIFTGATICMVNMVHAGIISSSRVLARVQSITKTAFNVNNDMYGGALFGNDSLNSLMNHVAWMEYGIFRAKYLFKEANYGKVKIDDGLPAYSTVLWYSMLTQGLEKGNSTMNVFKKYKSKRTSKCTGVSLNLLTPQALVHGKTGDALFDCIQNVLVHYGFEPTPGPVLHYWLATLCLRLPSIQMGLNTATCQISTHSLHSAETSPSLVPSILNAMTELNNFLSSDDRFKDENEEGTIDILSVLRDIMVKQVGSKIQLDYLLSVYCKAVTEIHNEGN